jgi:hypothetical protein
MTEFAPVARALVRPLYSTICSTSRFSFVCAREPVGASACAVKARLGGESAGLQRDRVCAPDAFGDADLRSVEFSGGNRV